MSSQCTQRGGLEAAWGHAGTEASEERKKGSRLNTGALWLPSLINAKCKSKDPIGPCSWGPRDVFPVSSCHQVTGGYGQLWSPFPTWDSYLLPLWITDFYHVPCSQEPNSRPSLLGSLVFRGRGPIDCFSTIQQWFIFSDDAVSWQSLADWLLCSTWCQLELGWGWSIQNVHDWHDTSAGEAGIAGAWPGLPSDGYSLVSSLIQASFHGQLDSQKAKTEVARPNRTFHCNPLVKSSHRDNPTQRENK